MRGWGGLLLTLESSGGRFELPYRLVEAPPTSSSTNRPFPHGRRAATSRDTSSSSSWISPHLSRVGVGIAVRRGGQDRWRACSRLSTPTALRMYAESPRGFGGAPCGFGAPRKRDVRRPTAQGLAQDLVAGVTTVGAVTRQVPITFWGRLRPASGCSLSRLLSRLDRIRRRPLAVAEPERSRSIDLRNAVSAGWRGPPPRIPAAGKAGAPALRVGPERSRSAVGTSRRRLQRGLPALYADATRKEDRSPPGVIEAMPYAFRFRTEVPLRGPLTPPCGARWRRRLARPQGPVPRRESGGARDAPEISSGEPGSRSWYSRASGRHPWSTFSGRTATGRRKIAGRRPYPSRSDAANIDPRRESGGHPETTFCAPG